MALNPVLLFAFIPTLGIVLGCVFAQLWRPGPAGSSAAQHFASGVVFAAVAIELLPKIQTVGRWWSLALAFLAGVVLMVGLERASERLEKKDESGQARGLPLGLLFASGLDALVDGLVLGIAFLAGLKGGILIAIAWALEIFFLGVSSAIILQERGYGFFKRLSMVFTLGLLLPVGALIGYEILSTLPSIWEQEFIAFGVAALLYLVIEELMKRAHRQKDTSWITAMFFLGFLFILLLNRWI
jgi:ZIP family zinc transporter